MSSSKKPEYALIIGAMKCGTSTLFDHLSKHPDVSSSLVKEPNFFTQHHSRPLTATRYEELWDERHKKRIPRIRLEASASYTKYPHELNVPETIARSGIDPYLIYVMRDPIDRIESHINFMRLSRGWSIEKNWDHVISVSCYCSQLDRYAALFKRERILVLQLEDLSRSPEATLHKCCRFLKISPLSHIDSKRRANERSNNSRMARAIAESPIGRYKHVLPNPMRRLMKHTLALFNANDTFRLSPDMRRHLRGRLAADMEALEQRWGVNVGPWGFGSCVLPRSHAGIGSADDKN